MSNCCACFGPQDSFFLNSPTKWSFEGLPAGLQKLISTEPKAREIHEMALGPDGSYAATYTNSAGTIMITRQNLPAGLEKWLVPREGGPLSAQRDLRTMQIALGPNGSYFAFDKNGSAWGSLPSGLDNAIKQRRDSKGRFKTNEGPQSVTLGVDGAYVFTSVGGGGSWNLNGEATNLNSFLHGAKSLKDVCVVLSPCRTGVFLVIFGNGGASATMPGGQMDKYNAFAADWKQSCQSAIAQQQTRNNAAHQRQQNLRNSVSLGKSVIKGLGLVGQILNAANGNSNNGGGYSGGADFSTFTTDSYSDSNSFWQPIQSAASDPIQ